MSILRELTDESGQTVVVGAVGMAVIIGFLGLAIDVGQLRYAKRNLQMAADAAAIAAALEIQTCAGVSNCPAMQAAAQNALIENGLTGATLVTDCDTTEVSGLKLMVNNPSCSLGSADPNLSKSNYVEVIVSQSQATHFAKLLGFDNIGLSARAQAARSGNMACMWALDPSGGNAITVDLLSVVKAPCGIVDESSASNAFSCNLLAAVNVPSIAITGGKEQFLCSARNVTVGATTPHPADPLAYMAMPSVPACGTSTSSPYHGSSSAVTILGSAVLYPDAAYCGGITILPTANVTFEPGTYVLTSSNGGATRLPGGLTISLASNVSGSGVTFYNYGPIGAVTMLAPSVTLGRVNLTAPTSGTYSGMLFMQDAGDTMMGTILGDSTWNTKLEGTYYFPKAKVTYAASGPANYNTLVAYDIYFPLLTYGLTTLKSGFANDYSGLSTGSPTAGSSAVLVQ